MTFYQYLTLLHGGNGRQALNHVNVMLYSLPVEVVLLVATDLYYIGHLFYTLQDLGTRIYIFCFVYLYIMLFTVEH